jgi:Domain of unknown function (DUF5134)
MPPAWILDIFAALMLVVAAVSAARLVAARPWRTGAVITDTDVSHLLMGLAMAGMLAASLTTLSNTAWEVVFGVLTAWFGYRVVRDARANGVRALAGGHCAPHLVHSGAMLYMFLALTAPMAGGSGMGGMGGSAGSATLKYPTLAFVFALILIGYTIWDLDQLSALRYGLTAAAAGATSPALAGVAAGAGGGTDAITSAFAGPAAGTVAGGAVAADSSSRRAEADHGACGEVAGSGRPGVPGILGSSGIVVGCRIAMGVTMALMLFIMI